MKNTKVVNSNEKKHTDKTDWNKVVSQSDTQVNQNAKFDPNSPILKNKKYYKPEKKR